MGAFCSPCASRCRAIRADLCPLCQSRLPNSETAACAPCAADPGPLEACLAEVYYAGEAEHWMRRFKYPAPGLLGLDPAPPAVARGWILAAWERTAPWRAAPVAVVPIPSPPARVRQRGFAPAAWLARAAARRARVPLLPRGLALVRAMARQTELSRAARQRNVAGALRATRRFDAYACVVLVDDVVTTGATLREGARALRAAGAPRVIAAAAARTPDPG